MTAIREGQRVLDALCDRLWPPQLPPVRLRQPLRLVTRSHAQILTKARTAKNGTLFQSLWAGEWRDRYGSQSEADLALCSLLAFWCDYDAARVDHLFRQSALYREKWERKDYRGWTLDRACSR
jgi:primase-polymerase (primpol)-like protein